jgi:HEPN domain-containing protein
MMDILFDKNKIFNHLLESSDDDFNTMGLLFQAGKHNWALFMGHIAIEKLLKALFVKQNGTHAPFTHNLYRLAELGGLKIDEEKTEWLFRITTFNINARYDDYKKEFYSLCTADFTKEWMGKIEILRQWIKNML